VGVRSLSFPLCTPDDVFSFYDRRLVALLVSDTNAPVADPSLSPVLQDALMLATARLEATAMRGGRYTSQDLVDIFNSDTAASRLLRYMVASLAIQSLWLRRNDRSNPPVDTGILQMVDRLGAGEMIFPTDAHISSYYTTNALRQHDLGLPLRQSVRNLPNSVKNPYNYPTDITGPGPLP